MTAPLDLIGGTPLLAPSNLRIAGGADLLLKLEGFNASGSVKARPALNMIRAAQARGDLPPGRPVVEPSSGNLGLALAMVCGWLGIECHLVVDPRMTAYSRHVMQMYGATVHQVDQPDEKGSWQGSRLARALQVVEELGALLLLQYSNPDNAAAHESLTANEIIGQLGGRVPEVCVVGVSTGGQISGLGRAFRAAGLPTEMVAVDVQGSSIFGGDYQAYRLRGLGLSWWPGNLDGEVLTRAYRVPERLAFTTARVLARREQIVSGGAAGAVLSVALREASLLGPENLVLAIVAERGDRYLGQFYQSAWRIEHDLDEDLNEAPWLAKCLDLRPLDGQWRAKQPS
ncbi:pyridoxal-phosphate dependent enzyme [Kutzneria viridogrisea]|uniref:Cysteine synthase n=1 Tax=Kutzneria viridogrisea TaxID=47990 RepID=A0ABR6BTX5_9PSEU|nr:cysteine synthase [Kutzneria viridogrisea]